MRSLDLEVWEVNLGESPEWVEEEALRLLSEEERERAARGTPDVRTRRLVSALAVRTAVGRRLGRNPGSLRFTRGPNGKPALAPGGEDRIHFSVSTSAGRCLVALSSHGPVGVDLELVSPLPEFERIAAGRFARAEAEAIAERPPEVRLRTFFECWTRKEACLKASGIGLAGGLDTVTVSVAEARPRIVWLAGEDPARWTLLDLELGESFAGAVVVGDCPRTETSALRPAPMELVPVAA